MILTDIFKEKKVDAILITDPFNMHYISAFRGGEGILYISPKRRVLITDSRYIEAASNESSFEVIEENAGHRRTVILKECIEEDAAKTVGYEDLSMLCADFARYRDALPLVENWIPLEGLPNSLRKIKNEEELAYIEKAEAIGDAAYTEILRILKPGMTELEVAAELEYQMKKHGAEGFSFDTIVASGKNSSMPHAIPSTKVIENGDFVTMDFGCLYNGYCSDMTRTLVMGKANEKQKEIYNTVLKAQEAALSMIREGVYGYEVDAVAREIIEKAGYGACFGHGLGHSVGLFIHEEPRLSPAGKEILKEGMLETVEPGIYVPSFGGVRIEDLVIVTKDGCKNLTHSPKELIIL